MKAVVMAAGEGSRMRSALGASSASKLLYPLLGLPIIERVILAAKRAGIKEFIVVTGYRGEEIERQLGEGRKLGVKIQYAFNQHWPQGNAYSLLSARPFINPGERFFLLMGDHIFEPSLLSSFAEHVAARTAEPSIRHNNKCLHFLAVDSAFCQGLDLDEATKVFFVGKRITSLGKGLQQFNGVDAGVFNFDYSIFFSLEKMIQKSDGSLSSALQIVIEKGKFEAFFFKGYFWQDIDNHSDLQQARHKLLTNLVSEKDGVVSRYLNRRLSLAITSRLSHFGVTPNTISLASFSFCLLSAFLFVRGQNLAAALLAQLASVIDGVDGEIARLKFQESAFGSFFDSILDRYADAILIGGISAALLIKGAASPSAVLLAGFLALTASPFSMLVKEKFVNLTGREYNSFELEGYLSYFPVNRDGRLAIIMLGGLFNQLLGTLILLAILSNLQVVYRFVILRKYFLDVDHY
ncbi:MAG: sugar phosphate nucleotidyltransferase [Dethiobacteria bacterium]|jgi:choline kinase/phosphatidylglycerophosphate synthase|nr:NTP transferase domain-containing protein [Bacillota bacterium]